MDIERQKGRQLTVIDGEKGTTASDGNPLLRLIKTVGTILRAVSGRGTPHLELQKGTDNPTLRTEQIDIEELCSLSPENFLKSPQFFKLVEFYKLHNPEFAIDKQQLEQGSVPTHIAHTVLGFFMRSRFDLNRDPLKIQMFNEFTAGIVAYLHDKNKVEEEDVLPGTGALEKKDQLVGSPDVIRRFNELGVILSRRDDTVYSFWCVFPRPTATAVMVASPYASKLDEITHGEMSAIEGSFRFGLLDKESFMFALTTGAPSFNNLIQHIRINLPNL
ncbi:MAG: hypothetical protein AAB739_04245 [Patescibacteria group bacterium]